MVAAAADTGNGNGNAAPDAGKHIFDDVFFEVIPSSGITAAASAEIIDTLQQHGATHCPLGSNKLEHVTHLISTTSDFPAYHDAVDAFIHVVKPSWVEHSIHKSRAANPRQYSPDPRLFLSDVVVICADDIPQGDKDAIVGGMQAMGGQYSPSLTKLVTHIVALATNNATCRLAIDKKLKCKIVLPHWFDACLKLGKKIDHAPYLLPDPLILDRDRGQEPISLKHPNLQGASQLEPAAPPRLATPLASPSKERRKLTVFRNHSIMLHPDLDLSDHLQSSLSDLIRKGGGKLVAEVDNVDLLICHSRDSSEFRLASRAGKDVGNLNWLYHLIKHNTWTSPTRRLLHYPYPKDGIPGFKNFRITVSNYTGEARVYLESLVKAAGGCFTKTMMQENTHLITAHTLSEKCTAAQEWNIQMVNHLWLEESYARCQVQSVTNPRYITFPEKTNLGEVVGQTQIDRKAVEEAHFPPPSSSASRRQRLEPIEPNTSSTRTPKKEPSSRKSLETPTALSNGTITDSPRGSRGAKDRAMNKLHAMAPDIALFQKESKRVGGVVYGGRRVNDPDRVNLSLKRTSSANETRIDVQNESDESSGEPTPVPKKRQKQSKTSTTGDAPLKVLITGWDGHEHAALKHKLKPLKVSFVAEPSVPFDVLVAPKILRTKKFISGIARAQAVVHVDWLSSMAKKTERLDLEDFALKDPETERNLGLKLEKVLQRAKTNKAKGGMLNGWTIFCTENAHGGFDAHEQIVRANGGQCMLFKGRETTVKRRPKDDSRDDGQDDVEMTDDEKEILHLITAEEDRALWAKFRTMAESQGFEARICKADWLLRIGLSQDAEEWQDEWSWQGSVGANGK